MSTPEEAVKDAFGKLDDSIAWYAGRDGRHNIETFVAVVSVAIDKLIAEYKQRIQMWEEGPCYLCVNHREDKRYSVYICDPCAKKMSIRLDNVRSLNSAAAQKAVRAEIAASELVVDIARALDKRE